MKIPRIFIGQRSGSNPINNRKSALERFTQAWHLLVDLGKVTIQALCVPRQIMEPIRRLRRSGDTRACRMDRGLRFGMFELK
ncbi:MAG: hypothetical protein E6Q43_06490 [Dokdonella sp.]|nr:MAG: hypothetical protein E6Q43_06490 [Dokdonella sp.]